MVTQAEVAQAEVTQAEVTQAEVTQAEVAQAVSESRPLLPLLLHRAGEYNALQDSAQLSFTQLSKSF